MQTEREGERPERYSGGEVGQDVIRKARSSGAPHLKFIAVVIKKNVALFYRYCGPDWIVVTRKIPGSILGNINLVTGAVG